jgi:hypothetical protein
LHAPGADGGGRSLRAPGRERPPGIDDRLAPPETRLEYLDGIEVFAAPAGPPHATQHFDLTYVLGAHVARGYRGAVDMLTRTSETSDFAPDASVFPAEPDPKTGERQLEEIAFEVTAEQALAVPTDKARKLIQRGVRRVFCILVKQHRLMEWSRETDGWRPLPKGTVIEDPVLSRPLSIDAILDAAAADDAVARALLEKGVPVLQAALAEREKSGRDAGEVAAKRDAILAVLKARSLPIPNAVATMIAACADVPTLDRWLARAVTAEAADEVTAERRRPKG